MILDAPDTQTPQCPSLLPISTNHPLQVDALYIAPTICLVAISVGSHGMRQGFIAPSLVSNLAPKHRSGAHIHAPRLVDIPASRNAR